MHLIAVPACICMHVILNSYMHLHAFHCSFYVHSMHFIAIPFSICIISLEFLRVFAYISLQFLHAFACIPLQFLHASVHFSSYMHLHAFH